jgi:mono/diheme cytochrome c family protein
VKFPRSSILLAVLASCLGGCEPAIAPVDPHAPQSLDHALVQRGAALAAIGNCHGCHTSRGGPPLAGGEPMHSPFGTIYSTNITPDPETGIGRWSEEAFRRAMRSGVDREGRHLYPAFPYERFTRVTDEDDRALYAYLMSRPAVRFTPPRNDLVFPFNIRAGIAAWKFLFLREGPQPTDVSKGVVVARGEYLVEGLGHCGSCHSPRNLLYAEKRGEAYAGGDAEGWHAYAIDAGNAAPIPWDTEALGFYLRNGWHARHGVSRGTMGLVTGELARAPKADVQAMAAYVVSLMGPVSEARRQRAEAITRNPLAASGAPGVGAILYATGCLECHDGSRALPFGGAPLCLSLGLNGESPRNLINVILHGLPPAQGETTPLMPGYSGALSDAQVAALAAWMRANLTDRPPWPDFSPMIREARAMDSSTLLFPPGGAGTDPALPPRSP